MMTSSNGKISVLLALCVGNSAVTGEFPSQRPVTRNFDVFFDLRLNKRLNKQSWGWWFETPSHSLWRHRNGMPLVALYILIYMYSCDECQSPIWNAINTCTAHWNCQLDVDSRPARCFYAWVPEWITIRIDVSCWCIMTFLCNFIYISQNYFYHILHHQIYIFPIIMESLLWNCIICRKITGDIEFFYNA